MGNRFRFDKAHEQIRKRAPAEPRSISGLGAVARPEHNDSQSGFIAIRSPSHFAFLLIAFSNFVTSFLWRV